jgi:hypothetical protein
MKRMSVAGLACRDLMMRIFVVFALSVSVLSAIVDPLAQLAVASDVDDASKIAFAFTPDLDPEDATLPEITTKIPDFRFDDLRAEREVIKPGMRANLLDELRRPYVVTARAKGLSEWVVTFKHALRNALMPVVTIAGLQFGNLISGAVLVETVFSWPGLGTLALEAILGRDYPTLLGVLTFSSLLVIAANLLTDLSYRWIDPRLRGK